MPDVPPPGSTVGIDAHVTERRRRRRWVVLASLAVVSVLAVGLAVVAVVRTSGHQPTPEESFRSPMATTTSWFAAVNSCDRASIDAHLVPARRGNWTCTDPYTHLHCVPEGRAATTAAVRCTFDPQNDPRVGNTGDTFWSIYLVRTGNDHWLVSDWGQP